MRIDIREADTILSQMVPLAPLCDDLVINESEVGHLLHFPGLYYKYKTCLRSGQSVMINLKNRRILLLIETSQFFLSYRINVMMLMFTIIHTYFFLIHIKELDEKEFLKKIFHTLNIF